MYWEKTLGKELYEEVKSFIGKRKISISMLVRLAIEEYIKRGE